MKVLYSKKNGITNKLSGVNLPVDADEINYDNTESELQSTNVQDAIDEVNERIDTTLSSVYKPVGDITCEELLPALLVAANVGNVYNVTNSGTTTQYFKGGPDKPINVGDNVAIVAVNNSGTTTYLFDLLSGFVDLGNYIQKSNTSGLIKNDGTIDTENYSDEIDAITNVYGGKNLLKYPYSDTSKTDADITWTVNNDGSIRASGTNNYPSWRKFSIYGNIDSALLPVSKLFPKAGEYILSCEGASTGTYNFDFGVNNGSTYIINENVPPSGKKYSITEEMLGMICYLTVSIKNNITSQIDVTFYPMIRDARISDSTHVPYTKTNKELTDETNSIDPILNTLSAKNLLPNGITSGSDNDVTWTVNSDGSITFNGTASAQIYATLYFTYDLQLEAGRYCFNGFVNDKIYFQICDKAETQGFFYTNGIGDQYFEVTSQMVNNMRARFLISQGVTFNNDTIYPMIRPANTDPTYVPYAMTNRELTDSNKDLNNNIYGITGSSQWIAGVLYNPGDMVIYNNVLYRCISTNSSATPPDQRVGQYWLIESFKNSVSDFSILAISGANNETAYIADFFSKFSTYRNSIFCHYSDQGNHLSTFVIWADGDDVSSYTVKDLNGTVLTGVTLSRDNNLLTISGFIGNWGYGFAIGRRV